MNESIIERLLDLNRQFYQTFAVQFSNTRNRLQPGVIQLLPLILNNQHILDLGCGNGNLASRLASESFTGTYTGIDFSLDLLSIGSSRLECKSNADKFTCRFIQSDLATKDWVNIINPENISIVVAFATLHHLPGRNTRKNLLNLIHKVITTNPQRNKPGYFVHSNWQFLNSPRIAKKIGLSKSDVDDGDYLLDWRSGGTAYRYVHLFSPEELDHLSQETGFQISVSFLSDGKEGNLSLYQIWEKKE